MNKKIKMVILLVVLLSFYACNSKQNIEATKEIINTELKETEVLAEEKFDNEKYVDYAKNFYTEYIEAANNMDDNAEEILLSVKKKYMTDILIEEMEYRSREVGADMIVNSQDCTEMIKHMKFEPGKVANTALAIYENNYKNGSSSKTIFTLHFREENGKVLIDGIDSLSIEKDIKGNEEKYEYKTKYANKKELSDNDKKEMESIRSYYDEMDKQGFID